LIRFNADILNQLAKINARVRGLAKLPRSVRLDIPETEELKLVWIANKSGNGKPPRPKRDLARANPLMREKMAEAFQAEAKKLVKGTSTDNKAPWVAAAVAAGKVVRSRIADGNGGDLTLRPLAKSTVAKKTADGVRRPTAIGYHTGRLYQAISDAVNGKKVKVQW